MNRQNLDLDSLYQQIRLKIYNDNTRPSTYGYNIDNNTQYRSVLLPKLVEMVIKKNPNKPIEEINDLVLDSCSIHIQNLVEKKNTSKGQCSDPKIFDPNNLNTFYESNLGNENSNFGTTLLDTNDFSQHNLNSLNFEPSFTNNLEIKNIGVYSNDRPEVSSNEEEDEEDCEFFKKLTTASPETTGSSNQTTVSATGQNIDTTQSVGPLLSDKIELNNLKNDVTSLQNSIQNSRNNVSDQSGANLNPTFKPDEVIIPETHSEKGNFNLRDTINLHSSVSALEKKSLMVVLDVVPSAAGVYSAGEEISKVTCELRNRLKVIQYSTVSLEFISFHGIVGNNGTDSIDLYHTFMLEIPELSEIKTVSNNGNLVNNFVIPNDTFGISNEEEEFRFTISYTSSDDFFNKTAHGLSNGDRVTITSKGNLGDTFVNNVDYFVVNSATDKFQLSASIGGDVIDGGATDANNVGVKYFGIGGINGGKGKLTSTIMKLKSSYMCNIYPSDFDRFTVSLKGIKHSELLGSGASHLKAYSASSRLQIGLMIKPN